MYNVQCTSIHGHLNTWSWSNLWVTSHSESLSQYVQQYLRTGRPAKLSNLISQTFVQLTEHLSMFLSIELNFFPTLSYQLGLFVYWSLFYIYYFHYFISILSIFCLYFVSILSLFCLYFVSILSLFHLYFVSILSLFCLYFVSILSLFCLYFVSNLSSLTPRCRSCRTYINPFVHFVDQRRWRCNLCYRDIYYKEPRKYRSSFQQLTHLVYCVGVGILLAVLQKVGNAGIWNSLAS